MNTITPITNEQPTEINARQKEFKLEDGNHMIIEYSLCYRCGEH